MSKYELTIAILNKDYVDSLIVALARQGYAPYINEDDGVVGVTITDDDITEIKPEVIK